MIVHKFGGACTGSKEAMDQIIKLLENQPRPLAITVSAAFGITNYLRDLLNSSISQIDVDGVIAELEEKHRNLSLSTPSSELKNTYDRLKRLLNGIIYKEIVDARTRDLILSFGERIIAEIIKLNFRSLGWHAVVLNPEKFLITDSYSNFSAIRLDETAKQLKVYQKDLLEEEKIYIIPGFYGISTDGIVTSLGRSGTDYSATAFAYAIDAEAIYIWKDVLGFMTSDPRIVEDAKTLHSLSYEEAAELSHFGASILHPRSIIPAKIKKIPVYIKNFYNPKLETIIHADDKENPDLIIKSITYIKDLSIVRVFVSKGGNTNTAFHQISGKLVDANINVISMTTSQTCISLLVKKDDKEYCINKLHELDPIIENISFDDKVSLISLINSRLGNTPGVAAKLFEITTKLNVNVEMISAGSSQAVLYFIVKQKDLNNVIVSVHEEFFRNYSDNKS